MTKFSVAVIAAILMSVSGAQAADRPVKSQNICGRAGDQNGYSTYAGCVAYYTRAGWSSTEAAQGCTRGCRGAR